jgi:hypothetical protein
MKNHYGTLAISQMIKVPFGMYKLTGATESRFTVDVGDVLSKRGDRRGQRVTIRRAKVKE